MQMFSVPDHVPAKEKVLFALPMYDGPTLCIVRNVPGGVAFFEDEVEVREFEDQALAYASDIRRSRRDPVTAANIAKRNRENGAKSEGRGGRPKGATQGK